MRLLLQRIKEGRVTVEGSEIARVGAGLCVFIGIAKGDVQGDADALAEKIVNLRIFEDESGKFNRSISEGGGEILLVSEFTLYGDCAKGRRPSFSDAAAPQDAAPLCDYFARKLEQLGRPVAMGKFQARMEVHIVNDGPVTFILES